MPDSTSGLPALAISATGLTKTYAASKKMPAKQALKGVDLAVPRGSVFGLLGPNGAGKSTFINILAGLVNKTSGAVSVWGIDADGNPGGAGAARGGAQVGAQVGGGKLEGAGVRGLKPLIRKARARP